VDTLPTDGDTYYYRLFVRTAAGISTAAYSSSVISTERITVTQPSVYAQKYRVTADTKPGDGLDAEVYGIRVSVSDIEAGASYQVFARTVGGPNLKDVDEDNDGYYDKDSSQVDFGEWFVVNADPIVAASDIAPIYVTHSPSIQRQFYQYKAVATKTGLASSESYVSSSFGYYSSIGNLSSAKPAIVTTSLGGNTSGSGTSVEFTLSSGVPATLQAGEKIEVFGFRQDYNIDTGVVSTPLPQQKVLVATIVAPPADDASAIATTVDATNLPEDTGSHIYSWVGEPPSNTYSYVVTAK
jgi:hypothetical protein